MNSRIFRFKIPKILAGYSAVNVSAWTDFIFARLVGLDKYVLWNVLKCLTIIEGTTITMDCMDREVMLQEN